MATYIYIYIYIYFMIIAAGVVGSCMTTDDSAIIGSH
jgi:hypothetical protein